MPGPLHEYQIRIANGSNQQVNSLPKKFDLEQVQTEASMVAEIFNREAIIYSRPVLGGTWQIVVKINPPPLKEEDG
jgi:hypothetical protein